MSAGPWDGARLADTCCVLIVFPDTNALFGDPLLSAEAGRALLGSLQPGVAEMHISPVVIGELARQRTEQVRTEADAVRTRLEKLAHLAGSDPRTAIDAAEVLATEALQSGDRRWDEITAAPAVVAMPWPQTPLRDLVERELARRRPYIDKKDGSIGQRDTVIWLGLLALAVDRPSDDLLFVTADKGFLDGNALHPDLLDDLRAAGVAKPPKVLKSLEAAKELVSDAVARSVAPEPAPDANAALDAAAWRRATVVEAAHEFCQALADLPWIPEFDPRDGGDEPPPYDADLPSQLTEVHVLQTEGPLDTNVNGQVDSNGNMEVTFDVAVYFDGFIDKADWYADDIDGVELWDGDWNDYVVNVTAARRLTFAADVTLSGDGAEVTSARLISVSRDL